MTVLNLAVSANAHDADEGDDGSNFNAGGTTLTLRRAIAGSATRSHVGLYFPNATIPIGATINSAVVSVYSENGAADDPECQIHCNDVDDANDFSTEADVLSRARTTAFTSWVAGGVGTGYVNTPDITSAVQEVIDRPGWESGNALCVLLIANAATVQRTLLIAANENVSNPPALFTIDYTAPTPADPITAVYNTALGGPHIVGIPEAVIY